MTIKNIPIVIIAIALLSLTGCLGNKANYSLGIKFIGLGSGVVTSVPAGINCNSTCTANFIAGTTVKLLAKPASNSVFVEWKNSCKTTNPCTIEMKESTSIAVEFRMDTPQPLSISNNGMSVNNSYINDWSNHEK